MENGIDLINLSIGISGMTMTLLGLLVTVFYRPLDRTTRRYFASFFSILIVYTASIFMGQAVTAGPDTRFFLKIDLFLESLSSSMLMPVLIVYLLHLCGEDWRTSRLFRVTMGIWLAYVVLLIYTQFSGTIYYYDPAGIYHRGPLYPLLLVPPVLIMAVNLAGLWRRQRWLTHKQHTALLVYLLVPAAGMLVQMFFYGILSIALATVAAALVMLVFLLGDQQEQFIRQVEENAQKEFDIRILQMRPHFIYNAQTAFTTSPRPTRRRGSKCCGTLPCICEGYLIT